MARSGVGWYGEARAGLIAHLDPGGTRQADLAKRARITRQAVQQLLDDLERDGIVERSPDPGDARSKIIRFTAKGAAILRLANRVKRRIDGDCRRRLGGRAFDRIVAALAALAEKNFH